MKLSYLLLCSLGVFPFLSPAQTPDLTSADLWKADKAPFSFKYNGKDSTQFLSTWQVSDADVPGDTQTHHYIFRDPATHLKVTIVARKYPDFPGTVDWVLYFKNEGTVDTPILENILPLSWSFPTTPQNCLVHHAKGSSAGPDDFKPLDETLSPGGNNHQESPGGNPSSDNSLPMFNVQTGDHGYILALGWTGGWKADFANAQDGKSISMSAGMKATHLLLHPGEEIRTPRILLMPWKGGDWLEAQNSWRKMVFAHYTPQEKGQAMRGPVFVGTWGGGPASEKLAYIKWMADNRIPITLFGFDAGWYGHSIGSEQDPTSPWWLNRGDWYPSPLYYPKGISPIGQACKDAGFGLSVWVEPETTEPGRKIVNEHPDWFLKSPHPWDGGVLMANYGDPKALAGITSMVSGFITDFGMTWYRQDFNIPPADYWDAHDTPDRIGMTEIGHVEGLYKFLDALLAAHPGLRIDNCASGGRRLDLEMMSRSFVMWRTDYAFFDVLAEQGQTQQLALWNPQNCGFENYTATAAPWKNPPPYTTNLSLYLMRLAYDAGYGVTPGAPDATNPAWITWIKTALGEYKDVQPYIYGDFYALTPYSLADTEWTAWQYHRPEQKDGLIILLKRGSSLYDTMDFAALHHIDPNATYEVEIRRTYDKQPSRAMKGSELMAMHVQLDQRPDSELIFYKQK